MGSKHSKAKESNTESTTGNLEILPWDESQPFSEDIYEQFLSSNPSAQCVVNFIEYYSNIPKKSLEDIETCIRACESVKNQSTTVRKAGYYYNSKFIVYEQLFYAYQEEEYGRTKENFEKIISTGLKAFDELSDSNGLTMAARTEVLLRHPVEHDFPIEFKNIKKAEEIQNMRKTHYSYRSSTGFNEFIQVDDLEQALANANKGSRDEMYCKLYLGDPSAIEYFKNEWDRLVSQGNVAGSSNMSIGVNYLHGLEMHESKENSEEFQKLLESMFLSEGDAETFTQFARMDLRIHSNDNGFGVIPWVSAGVNYPNQTDLENSLKHCNMGLEKISKMDRVSPYEYRNKVFCHETKGWIYAHKMPKTEENLENALDSYKSALQLYVRVENFESDLQFATTRHVHILKEVLNLLLVPETLGFQKEMKSKMNNVLEQYKEMVNVETSNFPFISMMKKIFENVEIIDEICTSDNKTMEQRKSDLINESVAELMTSDEKSDQSEVESFSKKVSELKRQGKLLDEIENNPELNAYYEAFIRTFSSSYIVSVSILQGIFSLELQNSTSTVSLLASLIPIIGSQISTGVDYIGTFISDSQTEARAQYIAKLSPNTTNLDKLSQMIAIEIIEIKGQEIQDLEKLLEKKKCKNIPFVKKFYELLEKSKEKVFGGTEIFDCPEAELGNMHATVILDKCIAKGEVAKVKKATQLKRAEKIVEFFKTNLTEFEIEGECSIFQTTE
eukprot:CAMPEP_0171460592 /NCGR_PEP_ID=MMETSP0945-20130129/5395_1 /TAXON_ID=109269 /ORGANISM="Vaucheria litorea, Strain CCMP2940" /LENGTH=728 /DNA_ID=CAMNT_0011986803 /DNA_START=38 /DNA_END=2224 /DNA_ORIENTATION=-